MTDDWRLVVAPAARRGLNRLPEKAAAAVIELLPTIAENPRRLGKPLQLELEGVWAARRGPYRVLYRIDEEASLVRILLIAHRADVYRRR